MSKYIVAGGAGFLGANLCRKLLAAGHQVQCVDDFSTGKNRNVVELKENTKFELLNHDLTKPFFPEDIECQSYSLDLKLIVVILATVIFPPSFYSII